MYKKKAMIKECQKNQISCFNLNGYIEKINKEEGRKFVMVRIFVSRNCFIYECRAK